MKKFIIIFSRILTIAFVSSCNKTLDNSITPTNFTGKWSLTEIFGNDYWGGPFSWKKVNGVTEIEFTKDGKYFRKDFWDDTYIFIGTFQMLSDSTIKITPDKAMSPSYPSYIRNYSFSKDGDMTWETGRTESIIKEKFKLDR